MSPQPGASNTPVWAERLGWCLAIALVATGMFFWHQGQTAQQRERVLQLEAENRALQAQLSRYQTPENFNIEANERRALQALRTIQTSLIAFAAESDKAAFPETLKEVSFLNSELAAGRSAGYQITYQPAADSNGHFIAYQLSARPIQYEVTGRRSFYSDESGMVRATSESRAATKADPAL